MRFTLLFALLLVVGCDAGDPASTSPDPPTQEEPPTGDPVDPPDDPPQNTDLIVVAIADDVHLHRTRTYNGSLHFSKPYLSKGDRLVVTDSSLHPWTGEPWYEGDSDPEVGGPAFEGHVRAKYLIRLGADADSARAALYAAELARYDEAREILQITHATTQRGGSCSVHLEIRFKNTSPRTVRYAYFTTEFYNAVGDRVTDDISGATSKNLQVTGPIPGNQTTPQTYRWEYVFWDCAVAYPRLTRAAFTFMDGGGDGHADEYFFYERLKYVLGQRPQPFD